MKTIQDNVNVLLLVLIISFVLFIIVEYDFILNSEIFIDIPLFLTFPAIFALLLIIVVDIINNKVLPSKIKLITFLIISISYFLSFAERNGLLYGKKIIDAAFLDDRSRIDLMLFENGKYIIFSSWLFGEERFEGSYKMKDDKIIFNHHPLITNDIIEKEIIIDKSEKKIYFNKEQNGEYDKSFYYFQIDYK